MNLGKAFTYLVIVLVMANNIEHLAYVHHSIARHWFAFDWMNYAHSVAVVVIVELVIIELVRRGAAIFAGFFAVCLFIVSIIYYPLGVYVRTGRWDLLLAAVIFQVMFVVSIYYLAVLIASEKEAKEEQESYASQFFEASRKINELQKASVQTELLRKELEELRQFKALAQAACTCPKCGKVFGSENARRGHMANCKI